MINARQVNILRPNTSGTHATLDLYMARKRIFPMTWVEAQSVAVAAAQFVLVDSTTHLVSGKLAVLNASPPTTLATNGGICAAPLAGAIGNAAVLNETDNLGNILNLVPIRDASTHDEITVNISGTERTVFGLVQCANGVAEGTNVGANSSENTQLSFVYIADNGALTLTAITATIDFCVNKVYIESQMPDVMLIGGRQEEMVVEPNAITPLTNRYTVTAQYTSGEVITVSTGAGAGSGTANLVTTPTGSTVALPSSETEFNQNNLYRVRLNGVELVRDVDVEWESSTTFSINFVMDVNDVFELEVPSK
jgi:hypothetical protein